MVAAYTADGYVRAVHEIASRPGECRGCDYRLGQAPGYLVIAAAGPGVAVCGHYLAEHGSRDYATAVQLVTALIRAGHPYVEMRGPDGAIVTSREQAAAGRPPFSRSPQPGASCAFCGDSWARWAPTTIGG